MIVFDLDDTLYKEADYVESGTRAVMDHLRRKFPTLSTPQLEEIKWGDEELAVYRGHFPEIRLSEETIRVLDEIAATGELMAIITDGRSVQQRNKYHALGLSRWVPESRLLISEEVGADKLQPTSFLRLMEQYPTEKRWVYVGDNPAKDFAQPNSLGWLTVQLLDSDGRNIHKAKP